MSTTTQNRAFGASILESLAARRDALSDRIRKNRIYRDTRRELDALSARELDDLGIRRSQIDEIAREAAESH